MKKTRKGLTLVEVIVSIAVFTIISLALFSTILSMNKVVKRQEEYVRLEMACQDIDYYWDACGEDFITNGVFSGDQNSEWTEKGDNTKEYSFKISEEWGVFDVALRIDEGGNLCIVSIKGLDGRSYLSENGLDCGIREVTNE